MKNKISFTLLSLIACLTPVGLFAELPMASPKSVGFSAEKLAKIDSVVNQMIKDKSLEGAVVVVARKGKVVKFEAYGKQNVLANTPMNKDTLFRIYSMTKPVTSVAAMMLWEQGKFKLDDNVSKYIPEFKNIKVYTGSPATFEPEKLKTPKTPITIRVLMRHTSGISYGVFGDSPAIRQAYGKANALARQKSNHQVVKDIAALPLVTEPGGKFQYGMSSDVLIYLVEHFSGMPADVYLQEKLFNPLEMNDTAYYVPKEKVSRLVATHFIMPSGQFIITDDPATSNYLTNPTRKGGGDGLVSSGEDYMKFCLMLLHNGRVNGHRFLKKKTIELMTMNHVKKETLPIGVGGFPMDGLGYGLGFSVRITQSASLPESPMGEYGWGGMASTHFWISPEKEIAVVLLRQRIPFVGTLESRLKPIIYNAIIN